MKKEGTKYRILQSMYNIEEKKHIDEKIILMYESGAGIKDICTACGIDSSRIYRTLKANGIRLRRVTETSDERKKKDAEIASMYLSGTSRKQIEEGCSVTAYRVSRVVKEGSLAAERKKNVSDERKVIDDLVARLYQDGVTVDEICSRCMVTEVRVYKVLKEKNVALRRPAISQDRKERIRDMYFVQGLSMEKIRVLEHISPNSLVKIIRETKNTADSKKTTVPGNDMKG